MAKALIINAFALTGRIAICDTFTQGAALGYALLPLRGVLLVLMTRPYELAVAAFYLSLFAGPSPLLHLLYKTVCTTPRIARNTRKAIHSAWLWSIGRNAR